jgi:hypothetical protein
MESNREEAVFFFNYLFDAKGLVGKYKMGNTPPFMLNLFLIL